MSHTLQEFSETVYLDVVDKILEELENLEYTSEWCHSENLRYIFDKTSSKKQSQEMLSIINQTLLKSHQKGPLMDGRMIYKIKCD